MPSASRDDLRRLHFIDALFAHVTGHDLYLANQIKGAITFSLAELEALLGQEYPELAIDEAVVEEQVARRRAREDELGGDRVGGALGLGGAEGVEHHGGVAGEVADAGVELGQGDAHGWGL